MNTHMYTLSYVWLYIHKHFGKYKHIYIYAHMNVYWLVCRKQKKGQIQFIDARNTASSSILTRFTTSEFYLYIYLVFGIYMYVHIFFFKYRVCVYQRKGPFYIINSKNILQTYNSFMQLGTYIHYKEIKYQNPQMENHTNTFGYKQKHQIFYRFLYT